MDKENQMISITLLIIAIVFNATLNEREGRSWVGLSIIIPTGLHLLLSPDLGPMQYFGSVALACLVTFALLEFLPDTPLTTSIQAIQIVGILINLLGYVMWFAVQEVWLYNAIIIFLVAVEWLRLMVRTTDDGEHAACNYMRNIRINAGGANMGVVIK